MKKTIGNVCSNLIFGHPGLCKLQKGLKNIKFGGVNMPNVINSGVPLSVFKIRDVVCKEVCKVSKEFWR